MWPIEGADLPVDLARRVGLVALVVLVLGRLLAPTSAPDMTTMASWPAFVAYGAAHPGLAAPTRCASLLSPTPALDHEPAEGSAAEFARRCDALQRELHGGLRGNAVLLADRGVLQPSLLTYPLVQPSWPAALLHALLLTLTLPWLLLLWGEAATAVAALTASVCAGAAAAYLVDAPFAPIYGAGALSAFAAAAFAWRARGAELVWPDHLVDFSPPEALRRLPGWAPLALVAPLCLLGVGLEGPALARLVVVAVAGGIGAAFAESTRGAGRERAEGAEAFDRAAVRALGANMAVTVATPTQAQADDAALADADADARAAKAPQAARAPAASASAGAQSDVWGALLDASAAASAPSAAPAAAPTAAGPDAGPDADVAALLDAMAAAETLPDAPPHAKTPTAKLGARSHAVADVRVMTKADAVAPLDKPTTALRPPRRVDADGAVGAAPAAVGESTVAARPDAVRRLRASLAADAGRDGADAMERTVVARPAARRTSAAAPSHASAAPAPEDAEDVDDVGPAEEVARDGGFDTTDAIAAVAAVAAEGDATAAVDGAAPAPADDATRALDADDVAALRARSGAVPTVSNVAHTAAYGPEAIADARRAIAAARDAVVRRHVRQHEAPTAVVAGLAAHYRVSLRERAATGFVATLDDGREAVLAPSQVRGAVLGLVRSDGDGELPAGTFEVVDLYVEDERGIARWRLPAAAVHFKRIAPATPAREAWRALLVELTAAGSLRLPEAAPWPPAQPAAFDGTDALVAVARRAGLCSEAAGPTPPSAAIRSTR